MLTRPALFGSLIAALALLAGCGAGGAKSTGESPPLVIAYVVPRASGREASYTGTVRAKIETDLGFRVGGKIAARLVDPGAHVRRGQVLMRLDPADLALAARGAAERLSAAQADATRAQADEARLRDLVSAGAISALAYDAALATRRMTGANLRAARASADEAGNQRSYAALVADSDGIVTDVLAQPGQVVGPGVAIVRLAHAGPREALIAVPESALAGLPRTAMAQVYGVPMRMTARLRQIAGSADPLTRTFAARYTLGDRGDAPPLGATISVSVARDTENTVEVPLGALHDPGSGPGVWVIGSDGQVRWRVVRVLAWRDENAVLASGSLQPGERIVALGAQLLRVGEHVRLSGHGSATEA